MATIWVAVPIMLSVNTLSVNTLSVNTLSVNALGDDIVALQRAFDHLTLWGV